jgi:hypothetical protein
MAWFLCSVVTPATGLLLVGPVAFFSLGIDVFLSALSYGACFCFASSIKFLT